MPKDLFRLKGFLCAGTDNRCYKDDLEELWGHQARGGVCGDRAQFYRDRDMEPQWTVLFPDACFYEFIPETEMY